MFTKPKANAASDRAAGRRGPPSIVAADMRVLGNLESDGDVQIDGRVDGDLRIRSVTIGEGATVNGAVFGETIVVAGSVNGEIRGQSVMLSATAKVVGDIHHNSLAIDAGAFLQGLCKRMTEGAEDGATPAATSGGGNGRAKKAI
jgi:cytoskeletal protein CcmA (bactofilin family)